MPRAGAPAVKADASIPAAKLEALVVGIAPLFVKAFAFVSQLEAISSNLIEYLPHERQSSPQRDQKSRAH